MRIVPRQYSTGGTHESTSPTHISDIDGDPMDFLVVSHSDTTSIPEARAKYGSSGASGMSVGKRRLRPAIRRVPKLHSL
jgi:hypothetical protein